MTVQLIRKVRDRQPNYKVRLSDKYAGACLAYLPSVSVSTTLDGIILSVPVSKLIFSRGVGGCYVKGDGSTVQYFDAPMKYADNSLDSATLIVIQRVPTLATNFGWHQIQTDATNSHVAYGSSIYLSTFASSRWLSGAAIPAGYDRPHAMIVTSSGTSRKAFMVNRLIGSTSSADAKVRFSTWRIGTSDGSYYLGAETYALVLLPWAISESEAQGIMINPWQIFEPETIPLFFSTVTAQYARPTSDVSTGTWTASTGSDLFAMLDETTASDTDYIVTTGTSTCEVALGTLSDPASSTGHIVRYRISATGGGITVRLRQGTTTIATWTHASAPTSLTTYAQTLTSGEADSITDYTTLRLQFEAT